MEHVLSLSATPQGSTIDLVFGIARLEPDCPLAGFQIDGATHVKSSAPNVVRFRKQADSIRIALGKQCDLVKIIASGEHARILHVFVPREGKCPDDFDYLMDLGAIGGPAGRTKSPKQYLLEVDGFLEKSEPGRRRRYARYFAELNAASHSHLVDAMNARDLIVGGSQELRKRSTAETKVRLNNRIVGRARKEPLEPPSDYIRPFVEHLSRLQLSLIDKYFSTKYGQIDVEDYQEASELFANGDLRTRLPSYFYCVQPSSGYYFYFGEFALLAIDCNVPESHLWRRLAASLIRSQILFMRAYAPKSKGGFEEYCPCNYEKRKAFTLEERLALRETVPLPDHEAVVCQADKNAIEAFPTL